MRKVFDLLLRLEIFSISVILFSLIFLTVINVVLRYFFNAPIQWAEEVQLAIFVWLIFAGMGIVYRNDGFISVDVVDIILNKKKKFKKIYSLFIEIFIYIMLIIIMFWSIQITLQAKVKVTNILRIPYRLIDISLVFGCFSVLASIFMKKLIGDKK